MDQLRCVASGDVPYALISHAGATGVPGFFTPAEVPLQVGIVDHRAGYVSPPHRHLASSAPLECVCEVLFVQSGRIEIEVFDDAWKVLDVDVLGPGDCVVFIRGGHAVRALEATRLVEVKQGPYPGDGLAKVFMAAP